MTGRAFRHLSYPSAAFPQPFAENHFGVLFLCGNIRHDTPRNSSFLPAPCQVPHLQLSRPIFIYPLFFLHLAHSFVQWALHNSFCFNRFRTLSIATGVWGIALVCLIKKILACPLWNLFGRPNLTFRVSSNPLPSAQNSSSSLGFSGVTL